jgi:alkylated DNA nucleotide flippase Atl1
MSYSNQPVRPSSPAIGYGLLWQTTDWGYAAMGNGGHIIAVIPSKGLVVVHRVLYELPREDVVSYRDIDAMIRLIMAAAPARKQVRDPFCRVEVYSSIGSFVGSYREPRSVP